MFASTASARSSLRTFIKTFGLAAACTAMEETINEHGQLTAYGRGRRTLEQQVFVEVRDAVRTLSKEECTRADRKEGKDVKVTATARKEVAAMLKQYGAETFISFLTTLYPENKNVAICASNATLAQERLADRRSKFMPSETAQSLGVVTLLPEPKATV